VRGSSAIRKKKSISNKMPGIRGRKQGFSFSPVSSRLPSVTKSPPSGCLYGSDLQEGGSPDPESLWAKGAFFIDIQGSGGEE
jgi:hypothetical protein